MNRYLPILSSFNTKKVLVLGETIVDAFYSGDTQRLSREAPVPIVDIETITMVPGGAANTASNIATLGAHVRFLSVCGDDQDGRALISLLDEKGVDTAAVYVDDERSTLSKKRIVSDNQQLVRFDTGTTENLSRKTELFIIHFLDQHFKDADLIILSDYGYGFFTPGVISLLNSLQNKHHKSIILDTKYPSRFSSIKVTAIKPNYEQTIQYLGIAPQNEHRRTQILTYGSKLLNSINAEIVACTVDVEGSVILERGKKPLLTDTTARPNMNASGAGDTFVSAFGLALASKASTEDAATIASKAAEIVVQRRGTTQCTLSELTSAFTPHRKILTGFEEMKFLVREYKDKGRRIVCTSGCFDAVHGGHISFLKDAKKEGDILIVAVNSDESVQNLTGSRPQYSLEERLAVLREMQVIDHIISFDDLQPDKIIEIIKPNVFVKGGTYADGRIPEKAIVERNGGIVKLLRFHQQHKSNVSRFSIPFFLL